MYATNSHKISTSNKIDNEIMSCVMNKSKLSNILYDTIVDHYKTNRKHALSYLYEFTRRQTHGLSIQAYFGKGECGYTCNILKDYLVGNKIYETVDIYIKRRTQYEIEMYKLSCNNHAFLQVVDEKNNCLIIDPTYKQLLFVGAGNVTKWCSAYTEYLFNLPPIFIGTKEELIKLLQDLKMKRLQDEEHCKDNDNILDDWYDDVKIESSLSYITL